MCSGFSIYHRQEQRPSSYRLSKSLPTLLRALQKFPCCPSKYKRRCYTICGRDDSTQHHRDLVEVMPSRRIGGTSRREGGLKKGVVDSQVELSRVHTLDSNLASQLFGCEAVFFLQRLRMCLLLGTASLGSSAVVALTLLQYQRDHADCSCTVVSSKCDGLMGAPPSVRAAVAECHHAAVASVVQAWTDVLLNHAPGAVSGRRIAPLQCRTDNRHRQRCIRGDSAQRQICPRARLRPNRADTA